jgi:hypothetical protein
VTVSQKNQDAGHSLVLNNHKKRKACASNGLEMRGPIEDPLFFRAAQQLDQDRGLSNDVTVLMN